MGYRATIRAIEAAERRQQREAQRRLRELERQSKEQAKLSAIEQAHLEVERFNNQLEVLLSVHKDQGEVWDWIAIAASLPPPSPQWNSFCEQRILQQMAVMSIEQRQASQALVEEARSQDEREFERTVQVHSEEMARWEKFRSLAWRILAGEHKAYTEALVECNPFAEISDLGSAIHFTVHSATLVECVLKVNGKQAIPAEVKTLTSSEKVSVKPMPKGRFHEIYQDYICGCVLRVAREILALLPVDTLLVTAAADTLDTVTGRRSEQPVLSVFMQRESVARLNFDQLDPSDAMEGFQHRGNFRATRKSEAFLPVIPLTPADIVRGTIEHMNCPELFASVQRMREEMKSESAELNQRVAGTTLQTGSLV